MPTGYANLCESEDDLAKRWSPHLGEGGAAMSPALTQSRPVRALLLLLTALLVAAPLAACDSDDDASTAAPLKAFVSPVDGKTYCVWKENPHECPGPPGPPAAPFAMPDEQPPAHHDGDGLSATDVLLMMALFNYHTAYAPYYGSPMYYNSYIGPAWNRYPGTYYGSPGHTTIRTTNVNIYTDRARSFDTKYAAKIKTDSASAPYKTASGKTYKGSEVPKKVFSATNVQTKSGGGNANTVSTGNKSTTGTGSKTTNSGKINTGSSGSNSGKSSWSTSGGSSSKSGWGSSSSSSGRSSYGGSSSSSRSGK